MLLLEYNCVDDLFLQWQLTFSAKYQLRLGDLSLLCKLEILMEEQCSGLQKAAIVISQC
jgi:hypothetical protein